VIGKVIPTVVAVGPRRSPTTPLRQYGPARLLGRAVVDSSRSLGSYGMGGAGLFGLELAADGDRPREWVVLSLWGADNWLHLDGKIMDANAHGRHNRDMPEWGPGDEAVRRVLVGRRITAVAMESDHCRLTFGDDEHVLELRQDPAARPLFAGTGQQRVLGCHLLDAWVISPTCHLLV